MTRQTPFIYSLISCLLILSFSCKKSNETYPEVKILFPAEGATYSFGDTIFVTVEIKESDASPRISVLDGSINIGLPYERVDINGDKQDFEIYFDKPQIGSGKYTIRVSASNGSNSRSDFLEIYLKQSPLEYLGFVALVGNSLVKVGAQGVYEDKYLTGDYNLLAYTASQDRAVAAPESSGDLRGYSYSPFQLVYNVASHTGVKKYNALVNDDERVYSLGANGEIKAYDKTGNIVRSFQVQAELEPISGCASDEGLMICLNERGKENYSLQLLNATNGAALKVKAISGKAIGVVNPSKGLFTIAIKKAGQTVVANYEPSTNTLTNLFTLQDEPTCIFTDFKGSVLVSTTTQIYAFDSQSGASPVKIYDFSANDITYDKVSQKLLIASGNRVYSGDVTGGPVTVYHQEVKDVLQLEAVHNWQ